MKYNIQRNRENRGQIRQKSFKNDLVSTNLGVLMPGGYKSSCILAEVQLLAIGLFKYVRPFVATRYYRRVHDLIPTFIKPELCSIPYQHYIKKTAPQHIYDTFQFEFWCFFVLRIVWCRVKISHRKQGPK